jgi:hypothetical protein
MKSLLIISCLLFTSVGWSQDNNSEDLEISVSETLTLDIIFEKFPLCNVRSSLGQWCKALESEERKSFSLSRLPDSKIGKISRKIENISFLNNELIMEEEDWTRIFSIKETEENIYELKWSDKSKIGSYFTVSIYKTVFDNKIKRWKIISIKLEYASGETETLDKNFVKIDEILFHK